MDVYIPNVLRLSDSRMTSAPPLCMSNLTCNIRSSVFRVACEFASMILVFTLVYLFHGFQSHAEPLTGLLAESSSNTTVLTTSAACICPADQRSIWNILWSCLATIFACSWVSVHPNIPAPNESSWRILLRRLELMFWALVAPEMVIGWAFRQWTSARHLEKLYKGKVSSLMHSILSANTKS